jgi:hypothetical protein
LAGDTVRTIQAWLEVSGVAEGSLFRAVGKGAAIGGSLDPGDIARLFKGMATAAELGPIH